MTIDIADPNDRAMCQCPTCGRMHWLLSTTPPPGDVAKGAERYWEARWRDEHREHKRLGVDFDKLFTAFDRARTQIDTMAAALHPLAAVPLWRDQYPDGPDILDIRGANCTPDQVRAARAAMPPEPKPIPQLDVEKGQN